MKPLIILTGPTAVGKTEISLKLAKAINGEIISADSIQVYKYMDIGSAKIKENEMQGVKHYLIDEFYPDEEFNINVFKSKACEYIDLIYKKGKIPIITGGTGFYIQSVLYDVKFEEDDKDNTYRKELERLAKDKGNSYLHDMLEKVDFQSAEDIHENNVKRVIRALEFYKNTGKKISDHNQSQWTNISPYNFAYFVLNDDRQLLYDKINKRVDVMFENGLVEEVKSLLSHGYKEDLVSMKGIGYKEVVQYLNGDIELEDTIELIKKNTRHFAKRQLTWFRREPEVTTIEYPKFNHNQELILSEMLKVLIEKQIIEG